MPEDDARVLQSSAASLPPSGLRGFHIGICSSGTPIALAVLRPRCWSGKKSTRWPRSNAHSSTVSRVRRGADDSAVLAAEALERGRRVHVGDRDDRHAAVGIRFRPVELLELLPALLDRVDVGHVGHRAAGGEVGQDDRLVGPREDVGGLGHEVHAAEDDRLGLRVRLGGVRELERVADEVRVLHDLVALVEVAERSRRGRRASALAARMRCVQFAGGRRAVLLGQLALAGSRRGMTSAIDAPGP